MDYTVRDGTFVVQYVEGMRAYSKHSLSDYKNGNRELVLSLIEIYQKYFK